MARRKFNALETTLASSILFYDKNELDNFLEIYDAICVDGYVTISGTFNNFVDYLKTFDFQNLKNKKDSDERHTAMISHIEISNDQNPNADARETFSLWFGKVQETQCPMELADDVMYHFIWDEYKKSIEAIDKMDVPFKEKMEIRPKLPQRIRNDGLLSLDDLPFDVDCVDDYFTTSLDEVDFSAHMMNSKFVVVAARPSVGKSLLMLRMGAENAKRGVKCAYVSLEMPFVDLRKRLVNYCAGENLENLYTDEFGKLDKEGYINAIENVTKTKNYQSISKNLKIYDRMNSSADFLLNKIESMIKENSLEIIFLDYLQLIRYNSLGEWESLRALTKDLKNLAAKNNVLVVAGTQVSRNSVEKGLDLTDLFGSSTIENDADIIIGLERPKDPVNGHAIINVKILKNRDGEVRNNKYDVTYGTGEFTLNS